VYTLCEKRASLVKSQAVVDKPGYLWDKMKMGRRSDTGSWAQGWQGSGSQKETSRSFTTADPVNSGVVRLEKAVSGSINAPALKPMQALYSYLYISGYR
jgi:hypothetical protein